MIELKLNGVALDLPNDIRIGLTLVSPVFQMELSDTTASFSFNLPATDHNRRQFEYYDMPLIRGSHTTYEGAVLYAGGLRWEGLLTVNEALSDTSGFRVRLESVLRKLIPDWKKTKLREIDLGGVRNIAGQSTAAIKTIQPIKLIDGVLLLGVNGQEYGFFWSDPVPVTSALLAIRDQVNQDTDATGVSATADTQNETLILEGNDPNDFNIDLNPPGNQQRWEELSQHGTDTFIHQEILMHMHATAISAIGDYDYIFAPIRVEHFYDDLNDDYLKYVNLWDWDAQGFVSNNSNLGERWKNTAIPFPRIAYLLQQAIGHLGYMDRSDFTNNDAEFLGCCLFNNVSLDYEREDNGIKFNGFQDSLNLANHVHKDLTIAQLFEFVLRVFNLGIEFNTQRKEVIFKGKKDAWDLEKQKDWRDKCLVGASLKRTPEWGYTFSNAEDPNENESTIDILKSQYPIQEIGTGLHGITNHFPPPLQYIQAHPLELSNVFWLLPILGHKGKTVFKDSEGTEVDSSDFVPRAMIFRGMQAGQSGKLYPMLNSFNTDWEGGAVLFNYGLNWKRQTENNIQSGILDVLWPKTQIEAKEEISIEQPLSLNEKDLLEFDWYRPYRIRTQDGEVVGPIKQLKLEINRTGIESVIAEIQSI